MLKVVFSCGGTGGHINPAISIADYIKSVMPEAYITFIGSDRGMENTLVPKAGYTLKTVAVRGFNRKISLKGLKDNVSAAYKALTGVSKAKKILKKISPDVVIGTGGYASYSAVKAASKLKIPAMIHEQNAFPGVTTKQLAKCADVIFISFEESQKYFTDNEKKKIVFTGNPVNPSVLKAEKNEARKKYGLRDGDVYILSFGGSLGADKINETVLQTLEDYISKTEIRYTHGIGRTRYEALKKENKLEKYKPYKNIELSDYIYDMPERMAAADIVISRAGAITIAEGACLGKAMILIPSPNVAENHQYKNAAVLAEAGAAVLIEEKDLTSGRLTEEIGALISDKEKLKSLENGIKKFAKRDAVKRIAEEAMKYAK